MDYEKEDISMPEEELDENKEGKKRSEQIDVV